MDTNHAQPPKDMYQVPASRSEAESFSVPLETKILLIDEVVDQRFEAIAHEEVRLSYERITHELALSASGVESPYLEKPEIINVHPGATELLHLGTAIRELREKRHQEIVKGVKTKRLYKKVISALFSGNPATPGSLKVSKETIFQELIERESRIGGEIFTADAQVASRKFFYFPNDDYDEWFHQQASAVQAKHFTNSYIVKETGIEKSATYFDETEGRVKNVLVVPSDDEIENFTKAAQLYHSAVKDDYDLAA